MGLFDTIRATLPCPVCGSAREREIQTKKGPCAMLNLGWEKGPLYFFERSR